MVVRGAPAIGITAAYGLAMAARQKANLVEARAALAKSRPTAVNLAWALERVGAVSCWLLLSMQFMFFSVSLETRKDT